VCVSLKLREVTYVCRIPIHPTGSFCIHSTFYVSDIHISTNSVTHYKKQTPSSGWNRGLEFIVFCGGRNSVLFVNGRYAVLYELPLSWLVEFILEPNQPPIQSLPVIVPGVKRPGCAVDHTSPFSGEVRNKWSSTSISHVNFHCNVSHTTVHLTFRNFIILPYTQIIKLLITQFPPAPSHFLYLQSCSPPTNNSYTHDTQRCATVIEVKALFVSDVTVYHCRKAWHLLGPFMITGNIKTFVRLFQSVISLHCP
jgi:hypothetical protein